MATLTADSVLLRKTSSSTTSSSSGTKWGGLRSTHLQSQLISLTIRASQSMEDKNRVYKELGLFSLKKKIDDAVYRAEMLAPALELEEARQIRQEEMLREYNLWDDAAKSNEILSELADSTRAVHALKDLRFKAEEAKLITQLATMDVINYRLFKQAYTASIDVSKFLDGYEMSKLLRGPYDMEGACVIIRAGSKGVHPKIWAEQLLHMYLKWGAKQGYTGRVVDKYHSKGGGIKLVTVEFESKYAYGYLSGERGVHRMVNNLQNESTLCEATSASIDVIPLFLQTQSDLRIADEDMMISSISSPNGKHKLLWGTETAVRILHIPTGIKVQSSDERNRFANKIKALNRLKAKLLVIAKEQGASSVKDINKATITDICSQETRRYFIHPSFKLVQDMKTGVELPDLNSVLNGNIEPLISANINNRHTDYYCDDTTFYVR